MSKRLAQSRDLSMQDDFWPLTKTETLVLAGFMAFYLGSMFWMAATGGGQ